MNLKTIQILILIKIIIKALIKKFINNETLDKNEIKIIEEIKKFKKDKNYSYIKIISNPPYIRINTYNNNNFIGKKNTIKGKKRKNKSINLIQNNGIININLNTENENLAINNININNNSNKDKDKDNTKHLTDEELKAFEDYYICLIISTEKEKCQNYLIENELDELEYEYYRLIEGRKLYQKIWSHLKLNSDFLSTFLIYCSKKDYRFYPLKVIIYFNYIFISLFISICFYHDETMHKIYEESGNYNFYYKLPLILIADIASNLGYALFEVLLIDFQGKLIELKTNMDEIERNKLAVNIEKNFKIKRIIFYIISFLLQIFVWYFISCFFALYSNTQIQLLIDFVIVLGFNVGKLVIKTIINLYFKNFAVNNKFKCNFKILSFIFKAMNCKLVNILFECLVEFGFMFLLKL